VRELTNVAPQTYLTMTCFTMAMALYPEKQALAQAELDRLLCGTRLPTIDDRGSLPYIQALIWESLRWHVSLPFGGSHLGFIRRH
jgi:cytochrome P450